MISYVAVAFAVMGVAMSRLVPLLVVESGRARIARGTWAPPSRRAGGFTPGPAGDTARLAALYTTSRIIGVALVEGPAFLSMVAYMLEGLPVMLGLAVLLILGVAAQFP